MDEREIRLRCIEAAAKHQWSTHVDGYEKAVLGAAEQWTAFVLGKTDTLGLPKRK